MKPKAKALLKFGFLVLATGVSLVAVTLVVLAWLQVGGEEMTPTKLEQSLLELPRASGEAATATEPVLPAPVRVLIDVKDADVRVSPGPAGSPLQVDASYDPRYFALEQRSDPEGETTPTAHIRFRRVGGGGPVLHYLRQLVGATRPRVEVLLPPELPLRLELNTSSGLTEVEIGGLQVERFYAETSTGGLAVDVSEPGMLMERFAIDSRQSTIAVRNLGNASPLEVEIDATMGGAEIDLRGAWRRDAEIEIESQMAGGTLRLPEDVDIEGLDVGFMAPVRREIARPTLRFAVKSSLGGFSHER